MNILSKLPLINSAADVDKFVDSLSEADELEGKKERIAFHRAKVRNGPVKYSTPTTGQIRRAQKRALNTTSRKAFRRQVRQYFADQREAAAIRGQLQAAGVLAYASPSRRAIPLASYKAIVWIIQRFAEGDDKGKVEVTEQVVRDSLQAALNRYQGIMGLEPTPLSPAYVLPVAVTA